MTEHVADEPLFDAGFLRRLRALFHRLRRRRPLRRKGGQATPALGFTREFRDFRHYARGDDFRSIDWRLYARAERLFVRLYEEVQELEVHILVDGSASMAAPHPRKRTCALRLAGALSYLALLNEHRVAIHTFRDVLKRELPPRKGQRHIHTILECLHGLAFEGVTNLDALAQLRLGRGRGIAFVLSDLLGREAAHTTQALAAASRWPAETHVVHVVDPEELAPTFRGEVTLHDVETGGERRMTFTDADAEAHRATRMRFHDALAHGCRRRHLDYVLWSADQRFERGFLELLARGNVLARA